jgi:nucleoside-diphosphate-sugar epimerase
MAKVLITGGQGFIGSNLVPELESRNHDVWVCDLGQSSREKYIRCDVSKHRQLERIFEAHEFDYVYHLAAEYGRWNGEDYYENLWQTNVIGTKNILRIQEQKSRPRSGKKICLPFGITKMMAILRNQYKRGSQFNLAGQFTEFESKRRCK